jgi:putative iron-dependent peroxidase
VSTDQTQSGILGPVPRQARYVVFSCRLNTDPTQSLRALQQFADGDRIVVGLGRSLVLALGADVPGLRTPTSHEVAGLQIPSTPFSLWCWLRGDDRGELVHLTRQLRQILAAGFRLQHVIDAFQYGPSLDLTGYEDGTENPEGDDATTVAIVGGDGSSFVAVQQWAHDLDQFQSMTQTQQDHTIGRRKSDNEELEDAPESAHVKRTAQESFAPEAFVLRRSMPWADATDEGLVFVAFGKSFDAFEALLGRMVGAEDGIPDALFRFTRPVTASYFWCPPISAGRLDLSVLHL